MKTFLMYENQDFDLQQQLSANEKALVQDLELNTLFNAIALGDEFLLKIARQAVLSSLSEPNAIRYRQDILKDCLKNPSIVRDIYRIPLESLTNKQKHWMGIFSRYPGGILNSSLEMMQMFVDLLKKLKKIADEHASNFQSAGFKRFFVMIKKELNDEYFAIVQDHLKELKFHDGVLLSAELGKGNEGINYILRKPHRKNLNWIQEIFTQGPPVYTFTLDPRDESGFRTLSYLNDRGVNLVANAVAQSADHIDSFLNMLRIELAFYIGCLNLSEQLAPLVGPISIPVPAVSSERKQPLVESKQPWSECKQGQINSKQPSSDWWPFPFERD